MKFSASSVSYGKPDLVSHLLASLSAHFNKYFYPVYPVRQNQIAVASSATALGNMLGLTLAEAGDGILVSRPIYGRFELDYGLEANLRIVYADTDVNEAFEEHVINKFEKALQEFARDHGATNHVRAVVISNPNNPTGGRFFFFFFFLSLWVI